MVERMRNFAWASFQSFATAVMSNVLISGKLPLCFSKTAGSVVSAPIGVDFYPSQVAFGYGVVPKTLPQQGP